MFIFNPNKKYTNMLEYGHMDKPKDFYTIREFAKILNVHPNTVRSELRKGRISAFVFGTDARKTYRIPHSEIERLVLFDLRVAILKTMEGEWTG